MGNNNNTSLFNNNNNNNNNNEKNIEQLINMGYEKNIALYALNETNNDIIKSIELLTKLQETDKINNNKYNIENENIKQQREILAQAALNRQTLYNNKNVKKSDNNKNQPKKNIENIENNNVEIENKFISKAKQLAPFPEAVDMLYYVLDTILRNSKEEKYRSLKTTKSSYKSSIGTTSLASLYLEMVGFTLAGEWYSLPYSVDIKNIYLAKIALEVAMNEPIYHTNKDRIEFLKIVSESKATANEEEMIRRKELLEKVPMEPLEGSAGNTRVSIIIGNDRYDRRFSSDDRLIEVIYFIASKHSSVIVEKLENGIWFLIDCTLYPPRNLNVQFDSMKTLQALNLWPSCELTIKSSN